MDPRCTCCNASFMARQSAAVFAGTSRGRNSSSAPLVRQYLQGTWGGGLRLQLTMRHFGYSAGRPIFVNQREHYRPTYAGGLHYTSSHEK